MLQQRSLCAAPCTAAATRSAPPSGSPHATAAPSTALGMSENDSPTIALGHVMPSIRRHFRVSARRRVACLSIEYVPENAMKPLSHRTPAYSHPSASTPGPVRTNHSSASHTKPGGGLTASRYLYSRWVPSSVNGARSGGTVLRHPAMFRWFSNTSHVVTSVGAPEVPSLSVSADAAGGASGAGRTAIQRSQHRTGSPAASLYLRPCEHPSHTTAPQNRQWCRRTNTLNRVARHSVHTSTSVSGIHLAFPSTPAPPPPLGPPRPSISTGRTHSRRRQE
mmetsp:Transcript_27185/g.71320  ORF Transcript_27185/g.71320 Transcript_27185/m.71320 type:complete len:278 (+) Transcript_27185:448-1281(+)